MSDGLAPRSAAILIVGGLALHLLGIAPERALSRHEALAAQAAREMLAGAGLVLPCIASVVRTNKPPTMSWILAGSFTLFGGAGEFAARLPSVLAAIITSLLVAALAARFCGQEIALYAGLIQLGSLCTLLHARLAEADMALCAATTGALYAFARGACAEGTPPRRMALLFYACTGLAFLLKGLVGPLFVLGGVGAFLLLQGERHRVRFLASPAGLVLLLLLVGVWPIAAWRQHPAILETWRGEQLGRMAGDLGGTRCSAFYLVMVPMLLLPFTPLLLPGALWLRRERRWRAPLWRLCAAWFAVGMVFLSAIRFQHKHYAMPLLPPLSILMGAGLAHYLRWREEQPIQRPRRIAAAVVALGVAGALFAHRSAADGTGPVRALVVGLLALFGLVAIFLIRRRRVRAPAHALFATTWALTAAVLLLVVGRSDHWRLLADLARHAAAAAPEDRPIRLLDLGEHQVAFYLPLRVERVDDGWTKLPLDEEIWALASATAIAELRALRPVEVLGEAHYAPDPGRHRVVFARLRAAP
ncbi:MAG: ArnT family glycosyltransferase [Planctomycetaceae bacterium]